MKTATAGAPLLRICSTVSKTLNVINSFISTKVLQHAQLRTFSMQPHLIAFNHMTKQFSLHFSKEGNQNDQSRNAVVEICIIGDGNCLVDTIIGGCSK